MAVYSASYSGADLPRIDLMGTVTRAQTYVWSVSASAGDVVHFTNMKIPTGALITRVNLIGKVDVNGGGGVTYGVGLQGSGASGAGAKMFGSATISGTYARLDILNGAILPYRVSVSDDASLRFMTPSLTVDGVTSGTVSQTVTLEVQYIYNRG